MIIRQQTKHETTEQWDGTDIEPVYPSRRINKEQDPAVHDEYVREYREGDRFS